MNTITKRQDREKELLLEQLKKVPIVQLACEKAGVARATYYRWRKDDEVFAQEADNAIEEGSLRINDMAESQLLNAIHEQNLGAIIFWLKAHHVKYSNKVEITTRVKNDLPLTPEQEVAVRKALEFAGLDTSYKLSNTYGPDNKSLNKRSKDENKSDD